MKAIGILSFLTLASLGHAQTRYILRYTETEPLNTFLARYQLTRVATVNARPIHDISDPLNRNPAELLARIAGDTDGDVAMELDQKVNLPIRSFSTPQTGALSALTAAFQRTQPIAFFGTMAPLGAIDQVPVRMVKSDLSWRSQGIGSGLVAVIDTGVDPNHPFLAPAVAPGFDFITNGGIGSELTGLPGDILATINPTTTPLLGMQRTQLSNGHTPYFEPEVINAPNFSQIPRGLGHGTMVAGAIRMAAPGVRILPIRAFSQSGAGRLFNVIRGLHAAEDRGAKIANLSLNTATYSPELERSVEELSARGMIIVASAGNNGRLNGPSYPAQLAKVTGVASVGHNGRRSAFSNAGPSVAFVAAPGEALMLPFPGNRWAGGWGTSFAAPLVSGLAAKIVQRNPNATYNELQSALGRSTPTSDPNLGLGILNIFDSVAGL
ncbi:MAG: S8 family serine peptidase [Fimbriimonadaceae bacterium]|nr:S8 family serine peptidase [Fimbriimonadaceae bacterium]